MVAPSTGRIGGCRGGVVCAEAEMTTETKKTRMIRTCRCTLASSGEEVIGQNASCNIRPHSCFTLTIRQKVCSVFGVRYSTRASGVPALLHSKRLLGNPQ